MKSYLSILRGINVSGHKKILMKDLKALYEGLGFCEVVTYIQSGNVVFKSDIKESSALSETIQNAIKNQYGFDVPVLIRSASELQKVVEHPSFTTLDLSSEGTKYLITFLEKEAKESDLNLLQPYLKADESIEIISKEIYLHTPSGYGGTKLSNAFIEKKLSQTATSRNYKTIIKLHALLCAARNGDIKRAT